MDKKTLDLLNNFGKAIDEMKKIPISDSYWVKEEKVIKKKRDENLRLSRLMTMSREKFHTPFSI